MNTETSNTLFELELALMAMEVYIKEALATIAEIKKQE
jgi:hypothetical protein